MRVRGGTQAFRVPVVCRHNRATPVQIALLWISQLRNQNHPIGTQVCVLCGSQVYVTRLIHMCVPFRSTPRHCSEVPGMCEVTQLYVWHDSMTCEGLLGPNYVCLLGPRTVWSDTFICVTCLSYMCDTTPWHVEASWDPIVCASWVPGMCDVTYALWYMRHDSFICATWLFHMYDMTLSYVRHDSFICAT